MSIHPDLSHLESILRAHEAANFIEAVNGLSNTHDEKDRNLIMSLRAFYREPELLYTALAYASARGVSVIMAPEHEHADQTFGER